MRQSGSLKAAKPGRTSGARSRRRDRRRTIRTSGRSGRTRCSPASWPRIPTPSASRATRSSDPAHCKFATELYRMARGRFFISMSTLANRFFAEAMSPAFLEDPYPFYDRFRGKGLLQVSDTIWFALAPDDVSALLRQPKLSSHESRLSQDPAGHARLRGLVAGAFTPRPIETLPATAETIAGELIDGLLARAASGPVDLLEAFPHPFPIPSIFSLLALPHPDPP